ncbi:MAG: hypothetical protein ACPHQ9_13015 [Marinobacter sp.]|uniref:hypothetical protein n=1 Tax=Marinobacter sp. TaxID=50741 RepID=UPI003C695338
MTKQHAQFKPSFMRSQGGQPKGVRGATRVRPFFNPELVGLEAKTNAERRAEYERKLNHIEEIAA